MRGPTGNKYIELKDTFDTVRRIFLFFVVVSLMDEYYSFQSFHVLLCLGGRIDNNLKVETK